MIIICGDWFSYLTPSIGAGKGIDPQESDGSVDVLVGQLGVGGLEQLVHWLPGQDHFVWEHIFESRRFFSEVGLEQHSVCSILTWKSLITIPDISMEQFQKRKTNQ